MAYTYDYVTWIYDQPIVIYDQSGTIQQLSCGARIAAPGTQTITIRGYVAHRQQISIQAKIAVRFYQSTTCKAYISHRQQILCKARIHPTFTMGARIRATTTRTINLKTFVVWQQGYPVRDPSDPGFPNFTPTQIVVKANIVNRSVKTAQTMVVNAHISPKKTTTTTIKARIGYGPQIKIGANVQPRLFTAVATGVFNISSTYQSTAVAFFAIPGLYAVQSMGMGANIARLVTKKATVHFTVPAIPATGRVDTFTASAVPLSNAQLGVGAYIS